MEQALVDKLQKFLLELGKGFSFVARQKRITLDDLTSNPLKGTIVSWLQVFPR